MEYYFSAIIFIVLTARSYVLSPCFILRPILLIRQQLPRKEWTKLPFLCYFFIHLQFYATSISRLRARGCIRFLPISQNVQEDIRKFYCDGLKCFI